MEEKKKSKKKILMYYLILAACLLVIAAVTVTVIFTTGRQTLPADTVDGGDSTTGGDNTDEDDGTSTGSDGGDETSNGSDEGGTQTATVYEFILPVQSATLTTSYEFGYDLTLDKYRFHQGIDFAATAGDEVYAVRDGTVAEIVTGTKIGENYLTIEHDNGVATIYKYIEVNPDLKPGDSVSQGDVIGTVAAATGYEYKQGDHLHFEITVNGKSADPSYYLEFEEK